MTTDRPASTEPGEQFPLPALSVLDVRVYRGPNIHSYDPMIRVEFESAVEEVAKDVVLDVARQINDLLPGTVDPASEDVSLVGMVERAAIALQGSAGTPVTGAELRPVRPGSTARTAMLPYREERLGLLAGFVALRLVDSLLPEVRRGARGVARLLPRGVTTRVGTSESFDFADATDELRRFARRHTLGPTTASLVGEAERRGIPTLRLDEQSLVQFGYGKYQQQIRASITSKTSHIATGTASDKDLTKKLLDRAGLPVPRGAVVRTADEAVRAAARIGYPVVTKPLDGNHGRGVTLDLRDEQGVRHGFEEARVHARQIVVERYFPGNDHRVLVVNGEVVAVAERVPAHVVGDGRRTIRDLVEEVNLDPRRGEGHEKVMTRIKIDAHVETLLARSGLTPDSVPDAGLTVYLRDTANISTGGTAVDRTDETHPENVTVARRAAQVIGLDVAGIDLITPDITKSVHETGGGIVEVNAAPGFRMHLQPSVGKARNVAAPVLDMLFPKGTPCRMPIVSITGTNGKSTTSRMVAHILRHAGHTVGLTTSNGIYVGGEQILSGDTTGPKSAKVVLSDPSVDVAVLETARGGILREGLGFDRCDVGVVLNVQPDHLGLGGVETIEDLAAVKSLVVEVVTDTGTSVLNADDPLVLGMRDRARGRIAYFSMNGGDDCTPVLRRHIADGGLAVLREATVLGDELVMYDGGQRLPIIRARDIPATLGGFAAVNVQNALAACAVALARDVPLPTLRSALSTFTTSFEQSPGRLNLYDGHSFRVLLDYAHNPSGLGYLSDLVRHMRPERGRVVGVLGVAGDRRDDDIREMGALAASAFDEIVVREDDYRRGRRSGEGARLVREGALAAGVPEERVTTILDEREAVDAALRMARQGDLVVILVTKVEEVWQQIRDFDSSETPPPLLPSEGRAAGEAHRA